MISRDSTQQPWPSYSESFFTTAVHEIGHALGLQHTWTGSAMSQGVIRTTSRARPLDADDIASLAMLYGKNNWQANYGIDFGARDVCEQRQRRFAGFGGGDRAVRSGGQHLEQPRRHVSHRRPSGEFQLQRVCAPAAAGRDRGGRFGAAPAGGPEQRAVQRQHAVSDDILRRPQRHARPAARATAFPISGGAALTDINFLVQPRAAVPTYNVQMYTRLNTAARTYGYPGDASVSGYPGFLDSTQTTGLVIAQAASPAILPIPQSVTILGGFAPATQNGCSSFPAVCPYSNRPGDFISLYLPGAARLGHRTAPPRFQFRDRHLRASFRHRSRTRAGRRWRARRRRILTAP